MKKFINFITGLKLAIVLLVVIAVYSIVGTVLPQGLNAEHYIDGYESFGNIILALQFDRVYSSLVYKFLLLIFMINLTGCTIKILPSQLKKLNKDFVQNIKEDAENNLYQTDLEVDEFIGLLKRKRFKIKRNGNSVQAQKHKFGALGSSITHLGIIVIILGAFVGNIYSEEGFFNLLPGDIKGFPDYNFSIKLDDFYFDFRDDKTVNQYYSELSIIKSETDISKETIWVNNPLKVNSLNIYQTSYGWASKVVLKDSSGEILGSQYLRNQESFFYQPEHLTILLHGYFPDMIVTQSGEPISMTEKKDNPHYAVILYQFNNHIGSYVTEPGQAIKFEDYEIVFEDSALYTGLTYKRDFGYVFIVIGSSIILLGLFFSFYLNPKYIQIEGNEIYTYAKQNSWGFNYKVKRYIEETLRKGV